MSIEKNGDRNERLEVPGWLKTIVGNQAKKVFGALREGNPHDLLPNLLSAIRELQDLREEDENKQYINVIKNRWMLFLCAMLFETEGVNPVQRHLGITSRAMIRALENNYSMAYRVYHDANRERQAGLTIDYLLGGDYGCFHIPPTRFPRKTNVIIGGITYTITLTIGSGPLEVTVVPNGA